MKKWILKHYGSIENFILNFTLLLIWIILLMSLTKLK